MPRPASTSLLVNQRQLCDLLATTPATLNKEIEAGVWPSHILKRGRGQKLWSRKDIEDKIAEMSGVRSESLSAEELARRAIRERG